MKDFDPLFDDLINKTLASFDGMTPKVWQYDETKPWPAAEGVSLLDHAQAALTIGGSLTGGVNYICATADKSFPIKNGVWLYGPDIGEIRGGTAPLGRISLMTINDDGLEERQVFNTLIDLDICKHRVKPDGYKVDFNQAMKFEVARISKKALDGGISFGSVGANYIAEYLKNPKVTGVREIFITDPSYDFVKAEALAARIRTMTVAVRAHCVHPGALR